MITHRRVLAVRHMLLAGCAAMLLVALRGPAHAGITIALDPALQVVAPGAQFEITVVVTQSGSLFNGFDLALGYTPSALTPAPFAPLSLQEGSLMKNACANTFHRFESGAGDIAITVVLLCNGISVAGPGTIYRLRFQASSTPQTTHVVFESGNGFYDAGVAVLPVATSNATVVISNPVGVESTRPETGPRLRAAPNPFQAATVIQVDPASAGDQELTVLDLSGRMVRRLQRGWFSAAQRECRWNGTDETGRAVPAGVYYVTLRTAKGLERLRIVRLR